jgi:hypothetical protein
MASHRFHRSVEQHLIVDTNGFQFRQHPLGFSKGVAEQE